MELRPPGSFFGRHLLDAGFSIVGNKLPFLGNSFPFPFHGTFRTPAHMLHLPNARLERTQGQCHPGTHWEDLIPLDFPPSPQQQQAVYHLAASKIDGAGHVWGNAPPAFTGSHIAATNLPMLFASAEMPGRKKFPWIRLHARNVEGRCRCSPSKNAGIGPLHIGNASTILTTSLQSQTLRTIFIVPLFGVPEITTV